MTAPEIPSSVDRAAAEAALPARLGLLERERDALRQENARLRQQLAHAAPLVPDDNALLLAVLETGPSAIVVLNPAGEIRYANRQAAALVGLGRTELLGRRFDDPRWGCAHVDDAPWRSEHHPFALVRDRGTSVHAVQVRITRPDRRHAVLSVNGAPILDDAGTLASVVLTVDDITEAFETAERLRRSEEWRAAALRGAQLGVWSWDVGSNTVNWSPELYALFGLQPHEFDGTFEQYRRLIPAAEWPAIEAAIRSVVVDGGTSYVVRHTLRLPDGTVRWIEGKAAMHRDAAGRPVRLTGTAMDISHRVQAEQALRESEARLRALTDSLPFSIWMRDRERRVVFQNHASRAAFGDIPGTTPEQLGLSPATLAATEANLARALAGEQVDVEIRVDEPAPPRVLRLLMAPLRVGAEIIGVVGANLDLTAQRKLEQQLQEAAKIESLGRLAAGVAHDFNNLLAAIMGLASVAASSPDLPGTIARDVDGILAASRRGAALTQRLLAFARRKPAEIQVLDAAQIVERSQPLARAVLGAAIELQVHTEPTALQVRADPNQIEQVLLNLLVNARDAMPRGGVVSLAVRETLRPAPDSAGANAAPQACVAFAIQDCGPGIAPEVRARLFEPFFTTKPVGQGTGLGLSGSLEIARAHGGSIEVDTEVGRGSTFTLLLPRVNNEATPAALPSPAGPPHPGRGETLLLVEDDAAIRDILARQLRALGYRVLTAADAHLALEVALTLPEGLDLLVTDLTLPRLSGIELARLLRGRTPELGVVYITGDAGTRNRPPVGPHDVLLTKPFDLAVLAAQLRTLLAARKNA